MNYPSIKIIGMTVVALLIIGGSLALSKHFKNTELANAVPPSAIVATIATSTIDSNSINTDTDNDGLKDWEEVLWGTDSRNVDTDGDTIPDGKEVLAGQSPTIKGTGKDPAKTAASQAKLTETDKFGRELFTQYLQLRQYGLSADPDSQEQLVQNLLKSGTLSQTAKVYTEKEIIISSAATKEADRQYGNAVGTIFSTYSIQSKSEPVIIKESLDSGNDSVLLQLDPIIKSYQNILDRLLKTPAPKSVADIHLQIVNAVSGALFSAQSFKKMNSDPILTLQSIARYPQIAEDLAEGIFNLKNYLLISNITYASNEGGYLFSQKTQ